MKETLTRHWAGEIVQTKRNVEFEIKPFKQGAYVGKHLSFGLNGKVLEGNAIAANPAIAGEIRPSGMRGGLAETLVMVELGTHCTNRKGARWKLST
ncbi:MAG: hypothetical protein ABIN18_29365 [Pseudomonadota bacterium]